jgi:hypothetical protein
VEKKTTIHLCVLFIFLSKSRWAWLYIPIIPAIKRQSEEDWKLKAKIGYLTKA